jgi:S1-C subfamily serine protease
MYLDATVEISYKTMDDETLTETEITTTGVNVHKNGYILVPYNKIKDYDESYALNVSSNSGEVFNGKIVFKDRNYNLAIIKCEKTTGGTIKMAYVNISNVSSDISSGTKILAISSPLKTKNVWTGTISDDEAKPVGKEITIDDKYAIDYVVEGCYCFKLDASTTTYSGGAVFNKSGKLLGISAENTVQNGSYIFYPVDCLKDVLPKVVKACESGSVYENRFASSLVGFDKTEFAYIKDIAEESGYWDKFYLNGEWREFSANINFYSTTSDLGYYLVEDMVFDEETTLYANSLIDKVVYKSNTYNIESKLDLLELFYKFSYGESVTLHYYEITETEALPRIVTFTV